MLNKIKHALAGRIWKAGYGFYKVPTWAIDPKYPYFQRLYHSIARLEGDVVECGVGYGKSLTVLAGLAQEDNRRVYGFDSFMGFPEPTPEDKSPRNPKKGEWNVSTEESVYRLLESHVDRRYVRGNVILVPGYFADTVKDYQGSIALLHLDGDLYQSYKTCLEALWPKVVSGGVVLFDEYILPEHQENLAEYSFPGAIKAIDEFFGDQVQYIREDKTVRRHYLYKP